MKSCSLILAFCWLMVFAVTPNPVRADSEVVLYGAMDNRIGTFYSVVPLETCFGDYGAGDQYHPCYLVKLRNGYVTSVSIPTGNTGLASAYFTSTDCSGQAFLGLELGFSLEIERNGGFVKGTWGDKVIRVEWFEPVTTITAFSGLSSSGCVEYPDGLERTDNVMKATIEDASYYGFSDFSNRFAGFTPPISTRVEKQETVFCSGFESCPTN